MKIAVTYDNGQVYEHFGKAEEFKIYEVEDNKVVASQVVSANGSGHGAMAAFLAEQEVGAVICGGIGQGAQDALSQVGITVCSGAQGDADQILEAYLNGELESAGTNCDHHSHDQGEGCGCSGSCGSCGGGCGGAMQILPEIEGKKNAGKTCKVHYRGTFNDGSQFDSSYDRGEPLEFLCGVGMMIKGFDIAVADMEVGQVVDIHLMPEEAYGMPNPESIFDVAISDLPGSENLQVGQQVYLTNSFGQQFLVKVTMKDDTNITFDANHEMAGKELNFRIELVEVQ